MGHAHACFGRFKSVETLEALLETLKSAVLAGSGADDTGSRANAEDADEGKNGADDAADEAGDGKTAGLVESLGLLHADGAEDDADEAQDKAEMVPTTPSPFS